MKLLRHIKEKILPQADPKVLMQNVYAQTVDVLGDWVRIIFYDKYKIGMGAEFNHATKDLPH